MLTITSLSTEQFKDGQTGIQVNGSGFGSVQGTGKVRLYAQGRNQPDTSLGQTQDWIDANQTITAWGDTQITFTCVLPSYRGEKWPAWYNFEVTSDAGETTRHSALVLVGPNQTTVASQDAAGFIPIGTGDDEAAINAAEAAGKAYRIATGVHDQWDMQDFQAGDVFVADAGAVCDGGDDITSGWTDNTGSWSKGGQTQLNAQSATALILTQASTGPWDEVNDEQADFFINLSTQGGPNNKGEFCRIRRDVSVAAIEAAGSTENTLGTDPIETTKGSSIVEITDTSASASGGITCGEAIKITGATATGGIAAADLNGWHSVIYWSTVGGNKFRIKLPTAATSSTTGGGSSITREKDVRCYFDSGANTIHINTDPTAANTVLRRSVLEDAFGDRSTNDNGGLHLRGHPDNKLEIRHYSSKGSGAISGGNADAGGWRVQHLYIHHNHSTGISPRGTAGDYEIWDIVAWFNGRQGFGHNKAPGSFWRRIDSSYNNMGHYKNSEAGAGKVSQCDSVDWDQGIMAYNFNQGLWVDIDNNTTSDGIRRLNCHHNARRGIFIEHNVTLTAQFNVRNSLLRDNHWLQWDPSWGNRARPNQIEIASTTGTASFKCIVDNLQIEVPDGQSAEGNEPLAGIVVRIKSSQEETEYSIFQNCTVIYKGNTAGVPQSGFQFFNSEPSSQAALDLAQSTSDYINNTYHYTGDSTLDDVFAYGNTPTDWQGVNRTEWTTPSGIVDQAYDDDSTFNDNQSAAQIAAVLANWHEEAMPTWNNIRDLQTVQLGQAVETDTAASVGVERGIPFGLLTETDTAFPLVIPPGSVDVGQAVELDFGNSVIPERAKTFGQAVEADTGSGVTPERSRPMGLANETDTGQTLTTVVKTVLIGLAKELDFAQRLIGQATGALQIYRRRRRD